MRTIIDPGDEVISLDPGYVAYEADIIFAGGVPVAVPTFARYDFGVRAAAIAAAITPRTKMILIGNPNNPTGAVVPEVELEGVAELAIKHDLIVATDEVYSRLVYGQKHICIASLPGMRERTILLDGFSKAYAMTGWRVGYVAAPVHILEAMLKVHQYAIMCAGTAPQEAALEAFCGLGVAVLAVGWEVLSLLRGWTLQPLAITIGPETERHKFQCRKLSHSSAS